MTIDFDRQANKYDKLGHPKIAGEIRAFAERLSKEHGVPHILYPGWEESINGERIGPLRGVDFLEKARKDNNPYIDPEDIEKIQLPGSIVAYKSGEIVDYLHKAFTDISLLGKDSLYHLGIPKKIFNIFGAYNIHKISELEEISLEGLSTMKRVGAKTLEQIYQLLKGHHERLQKYNEAHPEV